MNPPKECQCCGFEGAELKPYNVGFPDDRPLYYCDLCAGTEVSGLARTSSDNHIRTLKTACYIGNALLLELRAQNNHLLDVACSLRALIELIEQGRS